MTNIAFYNAKMKKFRLLKEQFLSKVKSENTFANGEYLVVAAIDFGTTYSGYAWSFVSDFKCKNQEDILINEEWSTFEGKVRSYFS